MSELLDSSEYENRRNHLRSTWFKVTNTTHGASHAHQKGEKYPGLMEVLRTNRLYRKLFSYGYQRLKKSLGNRTSKSKGKVGDFILDLGVTFHKCAFTGEDPFGCWKFYQILFRKPRFSE